MIVYWMSLEVKQFSAFLIKKILVPKSGGFFKVLLVKPWNLSLYGLIRLTTRIYCFLGFFLIANDTVGKNTIPETK